MTSASTDRAAGAVARALDEPAHPPLPAAAQTRPARPLSPRLVRVASPQTLLVGGRAPWSDRDAARSPSSSTIRHPRLGRSPRRRRATRQARRPGEHRRRLPALCCPSLAPGCLSDASPAASALTDTSASRGRRPPRLARYRCLGRRPASRVVQLRRSHRASSSRWLVVSLTHFMLGHVEVLIAPLPKSPIHLLTACGRARPTGYRLAQTAEPGSGIVCLRAVRASLSPSPCT